MQTGTASRLIGVWESCRRGSAIAVRGQSRSRVFGRKLHVESKVFETLDQVASILLRVEFVEEVGAEVVVGDRGFEHVVEDHE